MTWKYETKSLEDIYSMMMNEGEHIHPDYDVLKDIAEKAYKVAIYYEEHGMSEEFIIQYLDSKITSRDVLCEFGLVSSILYPMDVDEDDRLFSRSHKQWLTELSRTKLHWDWKQAEVELQDAHSIKLEKIVKSYKELHELALSYEVKFTT
jgi:transposase